VLEEQMPEYAGIRLGELSPNYEWLWLGNKWKRTDEMVEPAKKSLFELE
jgi:hypothetical protein